MMIIDGMAFISDLHGHLPPSALYQPDITAVIGVGDLVHDGWMPDDHIRERKEAWHRLMDQKPVYTVHGNHDVVDHYRIFTAGVCFDGGVIRIGHYLIAGIGWHGNNYADIPGRQEMDLVCAFIDRQITVKRRASDILIVATHYPPVMNRLHPDLAQTFPTSPAEVRGIDPWIASWTPQHVVMGHIHAWAGKTCSMGATSWHSSCHRDARLRH